MSPSGTSPILSVNTKVHLSLPHIISHFNESTTLLDFGFIHFLNNSNAQTPPMEYRIFSSTSSSLDKTFSQYQLDLADIEYKNIKYLPSWDPEADGYHYKSYLPTHEAPRVDFGRRRSIPKVLASSALGHKHPSQVGTPAGRASTPVTVPERIALVNGSYYLWYEGYGVKVYWIYSGKLDKHWWAYLSKNNHTIFLDPGIVDGFPPLSIPYEPRMTSEGDTIK
ncbi:hypothetical protein PQX77_018252 [Marasmius sp. AFHP31]|nr:hypothetical protein PQX77_018252 [Marasmius sp. AFHP31]